MGTKDVQLIKNNEQVVSIFFTFYYLSILSSFGHFDAQNSMFKTSYSMRHF